MRPARIWQRFRSRRLHVLSLVVLALGAVTALGADCLASDLPVLVRYDGSLYVLPNIRRPGALRGFDNHTLRQALRPGDWMLGPLVPFGPDETQPGGRLDVSQPPGGTHWLGTDDVGRDVLAQVIHGTRTAFGVGLLSVLLYVLVGLLLGGLAGYLRGAVDAVIGWAVAVMTTFPTFLLVLAVQGLVGSRSLWGLVLVLGATGWAGVARIVRGEVLREVARPHVLAARASGASGARVLFLHVLPAARGKVVVAAVFGVAGAILFESGLSFLGLGADAPSWGRLLAQAQSSQSAWWLVLFPGLAISVTVLAYNFVAEGLDEALGGRDLAVPSAPEKPAVEGL